MSASLELQKALRTRLIGTPAIVALVPAANIVDRHQLPVLDPSIVLGEDQEVDPEVQTVGRHYVRVFSTLHVWKREPGFAGVKQIAGAVRRAIETTHHVPLDSADYQAADCRIEEVRFLRDPDGETSHGIVTIDTIIFKAWMVAR